MTEATPSDQPVPTRSDVAAAMSAFRRPVVIAHVVPDADALGSMFATARLWARDGLRLHVALPDGSLSQRLAFMFDWAGVPVASAEDFAAADGFIVLDTAKKPRCNVGEALKATDWSAGRSVINIDHHETNTRFGDVNWVAADAGSACELVYALACEAGRTIDAKTASLLYAGIHTDTLGFSLPTTSESALRAGADLVARGADVAELGQRLYRSQRPSEFDLLRIIYANTKAIDNGRIVYSSASYDEIKQAGCTAADIDDQIAVPRSLEGAQLAMLFTEGHKNKTRINFRGNGNVLVLDLASQFKGGGHRQAAGAILNCGIDDALKQVLPAAAEHLKALQV